MPPVEWERGLAERPEWATLLGGILLALGLARGCHAALQFVFLLADFGSIMAGWRTQLIIQQSFEVVFGAVHAVAGAWVIRRPRGARRWIVVLVILAVLGEAVCAGSLIALGLTGSVISQVLARLLGTLFWRLAIFVAIAVFLWSGRRRVYFMPVEDYPRCAVCGYNLTGLMEPRCPECGTGW